MMESKHIDESLEKKQDDEIQQVSPLDQYFASLGIHEDSSEQVKEEELPEEKESKEPSALRRVFNFVLTIIICFVIAFLITRFVIRRNTVKGTSMVPTLYHRDEIFVEKISRLFAGGLKRYDIVTADTDRKASDGEEMIIIKRVIGLPGERVRIENGHVYINDRQLEEPYLPESVRTYPHNPDYANVLLGEDEYYLLGDNRENSQDSRDIGAVSRGDIEGKLLIRFYPFSRFGVPD